MHIGAALVTDSKGPIAFEPREGTLDDDDAAEFVQTTKDSVGLADVVIFGVDDTGRLSFDKRYLSGLPASAALAFKDSSGTGPLLIGGLSSVI